MLASIDTCANLGNAGVESVSRTLGLEPRTFQRRLRIEKTSFRELFEEYLQRRAIKLLGQAELGEKEIAIRLGYRSLNSFIRAFRRWNGVTPGQFRERHPRERGRGERPQLALDLSRPARPLSSADT